MITPNSILERPIALQRQLGLKQQRVTWVCPSGIHGLVYWVWPIKEVDKYKDSKIDLETKKEGSNPYSTRTLVNPSLVAYIKPGKGAPRGTTKHIKDYRS
jgi:hypothetical protein